jgi:hypothetical protein
LCKIILHDTRTISGVYGLDKSDRPGEIYSIQPKKQLVGSDNWVDMGLKNEKLTQKIGFQTKPDPTQKTHKCHSFLKYFYKNNIKILWFDS